MDEQRFQEIAKEMPAAWLFARDRADHILRTTGQLQGNWTINHVDFDEDGVTIEYEDYFAGSSDYHTLSVSMEDMVRPPEEVIARILQVQEEEKRREEERVAIRKKQLETQQQLERRKQYERLKKEFEPETHLEKE